MRGILAILVGATLIGAMGCRGQGEDARDSRPVRPARTAEPEVIPGRGARPDRPATGPAAATDARSASTRPLRMPIGPLEVDTPLDWQPQAPKSQMRLAQFSLPVAVGDKGPVELYVFGFGDGGPVEENVKRWAAMFVSPPGEDPLKSAEVQEIDVAGLRGVLFDKSGDYRSTGMMSGHTPTSGPVMSNHRMLAAIVVTPEGKYFFRVDGPEKSIAAQKPAFERMIRSISYRGAAVTTHPATRPAGH